MEDPKSSIPQAIHLPSQAISPSLLKDKHKLFIKALDTVRHIYFLSIFSPSTFISSLLTPPLLTPPLLPPLSPPSPLPSHSSPLWSFMTDHTQKKDDFEYWATEHLRMNVCMASCCIVLCMTCDVWVRM
jgi:hypothetical protein